MNQFVYRAAQLDLARQMETPEFVRSFIDLLAASGYNLLLLYLEDRIVTASYPYPAPGEAYSPEQIRELAAYGHEKGVELFPCVATLGHGERFLKHPELADLAEVRSGEPGRLCPGVQDTFCLSKPEFYEFMFRYLKEVAELFPSPLFHVGLDEFFDFAICPECRKAAPDAAGEGRLFLKHILKLHDFLKKLGKRMVMWADMFEVYPEILKDIPRDVLMADWQYQEDVRCDLGHFDNLSVTDRLAEYQALGFEVLAAPHDMKLGNPLSFIRYGRQYDCVKGVLLTGWEKSSAYWYRSFPVFAVTGRLMNGRNLETAVRESAEMLFGNADCRFLKVLTAAVSCEFIRHYASSSEAMLFSRSYFGLKESEYRTDAMILEELRFWLTRVPRGREILSDLAVVYEEKMMAAELKREYMQALDFGLSEEGRKNILVLQDRYLKHFEEQGRLWDDCRPAIRPNCFEQKQPVIEKRMRDSLKKLEAGNFVQIRLMQADWYGSPQLSVELKKDGQWTCLLDRHGFKPDSLQNQLTDYFIPCPEELLQAEEVRVSGSGCGGLGVAYVALRRKGQTVRKPVRISGIGNQVQGPEYILQNDSCWCFLGEQSIRRVYFHPDRIGMQHQVQVELG